MKRIKIPMFQTTLGVFAPCEKKEFEKKMGEKMPDGYYGLHSGSLIWIGKEKGQPVEGICAHEVSHFVDWFIETRLEMKCKSLEDVTELRSYMIQYIIVKVLEYVRSKEEI